MPCAKSMATISTASSRSAPTSPWHAWQPKQSSGLTNRWWPSIRPSTATHSAHRALKTRSRALAPSSKNTDTKPPMSAPDLGLSNAKLTAPHRIYAVIKERIIDGTYHPGQRLTEQSFADEFESSRTPVRESIRLLASEGYVVFRPNSGTVVRLRHRSISRAALTVETDLSQQSVHRL